MYLDSRDTSTQSEFLARTDARSGLEVNALEEVLEMPRRKALEADQWTPRHDEFRLSVPVAWLCPCGGLVHVDTGRVCCPDCGRIPRDTVPGKLDGSQRCTTGRQGRDYKRLAKGRA